MYMNKIFIDNQIATMLGKRNMWDKFIVGFMIYVLR